MNRYLEMDLWKMNKYPEMDLWKMNKYPKMDLSLYKEDSELRTSILFVFLFHHYAKSFLLLFFVTHEHCWHSEKFWDSSAYHHYLLQFGLNAFVHLSRTFQLWKNPLFLYKEGISSQRLLFLLCTLYARLYLVQWWVTSFLLPSIYL